MPNPIQRACIQACNRCADACDFFAASCLREANVQVMARCIATDIDIDCAATADWPPPR